MQKKRTKLIWLIIVLAFILAALVAAGFVANRYVFFEGQAFLRSSETLDLREQELTVEQYQQLQALLPQTHIQWMIPIGQQRYDCATKEIVIAQLKEEDIPLYKLFDDLQRVDALQMQDHDAVLRLQEVFPDCTVDWAVYIGNKAVSPEAESLDLNNTGITALELMEKLAWLPQLSQLTVTDVTFSAEDQLALLEAYPNIDFIWNVEAAGKTWLNTVTELSYADTPADSELLLQCAALLPNVEVIDLTGSGCTIEELLSIQAAFGAQITADLELFGIQFDTQTTELDFSDIPMEDVSAVEQILPLMPQLQRVVMCNCGIPSEEMDALWKRNPQVRFVWSVKIGRATLRTDCTSFTGPLHGYLANAKIADPFEDKHNRLFDEDCVEFKYCVDMVCLDLGHMGISDYSFIQYMPKLKYLILADTIGTDFSALEGLTELVFLELFLTDFSDTEVLLSLTSLEDLNIAYTDVSDTEFLKQMPWLKRLWTCYSKLDYKEVIELQSYLPDTQIDWTASHSTGNNWRKSKNYYDMRDFLGMYYLD